MTKKPEYTAADMAYPSGKPLDTNTSTPGYASQFTSVATNTARADGIEKRPSPDKYLERKRDPNSFSL